MYHPRYTIQDEPPNRLSKPSAVSNKLLFSLLLLKQKPMLSAMGISPTMCQGRVQHWIVIYSLQAERLKLLALRLSEPGKDAIKTSLS